MSFDGGTIRKGCLAVVIILSACGEGGSAVDSSHGPEIPPAALARRAGTSLARELAVRQGLTLRLGDAVPKGWNSRVENTLACEGSACPDSGYWFAAPLVNGLAGVGVHPDRAGKVALVQASYVDTIPFDSVLAQWKGRLGAPSSESRAPGGDARVLWQDDVTSIELTGTPGARSKSWLIMSNDTGRARE